MHRRGSAGRKSRGEGARARAVSSGSAARRISMRAVRPLRAAWCSGVHPATLAASGRAPRALAGARTAKVAPFAEAQWMGCSPRASRARASAPASRSARTVPRGPRRRRSEAVAPRRCLSDSAPRLGQRGNARQFVAALRREMKGRSTHEVIVRCVDDVAEGNALGEEFVHDGGGHLDIVAPRGVVQEGVSIGSQREKAVDAGSKSSGAESSHIAERNIFVRSPLCDRSATH